MKKDDFPKNKEAGHEAMCGTISGGRSSPTELLCIPAPTATKVLVDKLTIDVV